MHISINKKNKMIFLGIILFRIALDLLYPVVAYDFEYMGFVYAPVFSKIAASYLILAGVTLMCVNVLNLNVNSDLLLFILYLVSFVPNTSGYAFMGFETKFILLSALFWFEIWLLIGFRWKYKKNQPLRLSRFTKELLLLYYPLAISLVLMAYAFFYNGFQLTLDFSSVYTLRAAYVQRGYSAVMERIIPWSAIITLPVGAIYAIWKKKWFYLIPLTIAEIAVFSLAGIKTYIFVYLLSIAAAVIYKKGVEEKHLPYALAAIGFLCLLFVAVHKEVADKVINFFFRRLLFTTTFNNNGYVEFFDSHEKMYLRCSFLRVLGKLGTDIPYGGNINRFIAGFIYPQGNNGSVPSGTFADAYGNFGIIGILIYPFLYVAILRLLDLVTKRTPRAFVFPTIISTAEYLLNGSLFTVILSYGFLYSIVYFYLIDQCKGDYGEKT